jgi:sugar phosphate permease
VAAATVSNLANRVSPKILILVGLAVLGLGLVWFSRMTPDGSYVGQVLGPGIVMALGLGMTFVPLTLFAVSGVPPEEAGLASGLLNTTQQVGGAIGLAVLSTVANAQREDALSGLSAPPNPLQIADALTQGYSAGLIVGALFALAGLVAAALLLRGGRIEPGATPPPMA